MPVLELPQQGFYPLNHYPCPEFQAEMMHSVEGLLFCGRALFWYCDNPPQYRFVFFCPRNTESSLLHKQNSFFAIDRDHYRRLQTIKTQTCGAQSQWIHLQSSFHTQGSGNTRENGAKKLQEPKEKGVCCEVLSPSSVRSYTYEIHHHDCLNTS